MFLIVDDNFVDRLISRKLLEKAYCNPRIEEVDGAKEAINWLQGISDPSEDQLIILLDIRMPEMNGFQFLDEFLTLPENVRSNVQIVMLSSTLDPTDISMAEAHQEVKELLEKPLDINRLERVLAKD